MPPATCAQLCVDSKPLRGTGPQTLPVVSAGASVTSLRLGQVAGRGKGHELAAVPGLPALRGALVSLDALSCQPLVAEQLVAQGGNYRLELKAKQPSLLRQVMRQLHALPPRRRTPTGPLPAMARRCTTKSGLAANRLGDEDGRWPHLCTLVQRTNYPGYRTRGPAALLPGQPRVSGCPDRWLHARALSH